ncbi:F0F1 ATP synthase subunit B [Vibrio sonorensis]|uniref:F0F1 ATP synthase subunit B n=1 Tax=Vibrio sonorensis TaxID=1004316 RepID=UPI0008DAEC2D|nr:F0F1 ATP synthase subunit B [Vibrio sonorensis]
MNINMTLIGQTIAFILFVWFCMKHVWPPILTAIEERQKKIEDGLASAQRADKALELAQHNAADQLKDAKQQAAEIIEQANKRRAQIVDEARLEASQEREHILAQGKAELEAETLRARNELQKDVAALAILGAEKIIERSIDPEANRDILDNIAAKL